MQAYPLFYEDFNDAIRRAIEDNEREAPFKQIAAEMWPHMKADSAYARLKNCLRDDRDEKLGLDEIKLLCRITGRSDPVHWLCDETGHARPARLEPRDRQAELMQEFIRQSKELQRIGRQLEGLGLSPFKSVA